MESPLERQSTRDEVLFAGYNIAMLIDWQLVVALAIVALAALYVARMAWRAVRGKSSGCGGCGTCSATKHSDAAPGQLVMLSESDEIAERS